MNTPADPDQGASGRLDFLCGLVLALVALVALLWVIPAHVPGEATRGEVAPGFFPNLTAGVVLICSLALMAANWRSLGAPGHTGGLRIVIEVLGWAVFAIVIMGLMSRVGFIAASVLATATGVLVSRYRKRLWLAGLITLALPFAITQAIWALFHISLP